MTTPRNPTQPTLPANARISRRAVARGAAWTLPLTAVSVAAPAFAASCEKQFRLDWGTTSAPRTTSGNTQTVTASVTAAGASPVTVTLSSTTTGNVTRTSENLTVPNLTGIGGLAGERGLSLRHGDGHGSGRNNRQTILVTFSRPVSGLGFTVTDLDSLNNPGNSDFWDAIEIDGIRTGTRAPNVVGTGTNGDPWRYDDNDTGVGDQTGGGNVAVSFPGPVSSFTILYYSQTSGAEERVFLSDFTFTATCA